MCSDFRVRVCTRNVRLVQGVTDETIIDFTPELRARAGVLVTKTPLFATEGSGRSGSGTKGGQRLARLRQGDRGGTRAHRTARRADGRTDDLSSRRQAIRRHRSGEESGATRRVGVARITTLACNHYLVASILGINGGRYWNRTSDFLPVKQAL